MSHLQSLITKHCPEGVPTLELGEIGEFTRGRRFTKKDVVAQGKVLDAQTAKRLPIQTSRGVERHANISSSHAESRVVGREPELTISGVDLKAV